jgi:phosphoglycerol transferase
MSDGRLQVDRPADVASPQTRIRRARSFTRLTPPVYSVTAVLAVAITGVMLKLWHADLHVPLYYAKAGDSVFAAVQAKQILDTGWIYNDRWLGAPFGGTYYDFPTLSLLHLLAQKALIALTQSPAFALNVYYLASYPLCALSAVYVLRRIGLPPVISIGCGLLYAFIPGHFERNEAHLYYSLYFFVPLACLVCLWIAQGEALWKRYRGWFVPNRDGWIAIGTMLAIGSDNQYHAFFTLTFLIVAAFIGIARTRRALPALATLVLLLCLGCSFGLNVLPSLKYEHREGPNPSAFTRFPQEAQIYGLTISQLVLPIAQHRDPKLAAKREFYDSVFPLLINENSFVTLGAIGTAGFVFLLAAFILRAGRPIPIHLETLAILNGFGLLLATIGGFGALFNYFVWPGFRAYNRISPFIAFFALAAVAIALRSVRVHLLPPRFSARFALGMAGLTVLGLWDQSSPAFVPPYAADAAVYTSDDRFVRQIEAVLPDDGAVFELPYIPFPEHAPVAELDPARQMMPYLHSSRLRWTTMAIKGRAAAQWQARVADLDPAGFLAAAVLSGFEGVVVFRDAYPDRGADLERQLAAITRAQPLRSAAGDLAFFSLADLHRRVAQLAPSSVSPASEQRWLELAAANVTYGAGFSIEEHDARSRWRWSDRESRIVLTNAGPSRVAFSFNAVVQPALPRPAKLTIEAFGRTTSYALPAAGKAVSLRANVDPGEHDVVFRTTGAQLSVPGDARPLFFRLDEPQATLSGAPVPDRVRAIFAPPSGVPSLTSLPALVSAGGCYPLEHGATGYWRWCAAEGEFTFANPGVSKDVSFEITASAPGTSVSHVFFTGAGLRKTLVLNPADVHGTLRLRLQRGTTTVRFASDSRPYAAPGDTRSLVLRFDQLDVVP